MKRIIILIPLILILFAGVCIQPEQYSGVNEITLQEMFIESLDGDTSPDSLLDFSETTDDDVLFYPDAFLNDTAVVASAGKYTETQQQGTWETTKVVADVWQVKDETGPSYEPEMYLNFTVPSTIQVEGFVVNVYGFYTEMGTDTDTNLIGIYDGAAWDDIGDIDNAAPSVWVNSSGYYDPAYWQHDVVMVKLEVILDDGAVALYIQYVECQFYTMTLADADHYAEGFNDISEWTLGIASGIAGGEYSFTTDDDVGTIKVTFNDAGNEYVRYDFDMTGLGWNYDDDAYLEFRYKVDNADCFGRVRFYDTAEQTATVAENLASTTWTTIKVRLSGYASDSDAITRISVYADDATDPVASGIHYLYLDYLRIGPADEMGWSHDGSTTEGVTDDGDGDFTYSKSSDGDILTLDFTFDTGGGTQWGDFLIEYDTTTTASDIETSYYPFLEINWTCTAINGSTVYLAVQGDGKKHSPLGGYHTTTFDWTVETINFLAETTVGTSKYLDFIMMADQSTESATVKIDYVKFYSIVNFTVTHGAGIDTSDYLYVDGSGNLVSEYDDSGGSGDDWIRVYNDVALSVATGTYNVWNITVSTSGTGTDGGYVHRFYPYTPAAVRDDTNFDITRNAFVASDTFTYYYFYFYEDCVLNAIEFWEDTTDPTIDTMFVNPNDPTDSEAVSFTVAVTDWTSLYKLTLNAVEYPTGFSDVDYEATETGATNLWKYEFTTMTAGYYLFSVTADDGQGTDVDYISLTVRETTIDIKDISLFGVGPDFTSMTYSFRSNLAGTYTITEWTDNVAAADTYTGSIVEGRNNINWAKLDTDEATVYFNFSIVSGSLSEVIQGEYQQAKTTFYYSIDSTNDGYDTYTLSGSISKGCNYIVYKNDSTLVKTGSLDANEFELSFSKWAVGDENEHGFSIRFANGSQVIWYNSTFYNLAKESGGGGGSPVGWAFDMEFWQVLFAIGVIGLVLTGLNVGAMKYLNLPNWRQT